MAITYGASPGTVITSFAMNETLAAQTQQTGNNTVVVSDTLVNAGNGQIGDGTDGIGDSYVGRLLIIDLGLSTEQIRFCTAEAAGTGTTRILTVSEDWDTNPVATTDTIHVPYEPADIENGGAGGGINLNSKTGLWELSNVLTLSSAGGGLQVTGGKGFEADDRGTNIAVIIQNTASAFVGYPNAAGRPIEGAVCPFYNNAAGEPSWQIQSGGSLRAYDTLFWSQVVSQQFEFANGNTSILKRVKWISATQELILYDVDLEDSGVSGRGGASEIVRVDAGTVFFGFVLANVQKLDSAADTTTETIELEGVVFVGVPGYVDVRQNKTWNLVDPVWDVTVYTQLTWTGTATGNELNERRSIKVTVQTAAGTKLQDALVNVYENTQLDDLVLELVTAATTGYAEGSFIHRKHATNSVTTTYGGHALQVGKWLYSPLVFTQAADDKFNGTITLALDPNIVQTTQATAITDGSGVTWNEDTNASAIIKFTGGVNTLAVGETVTGGTSGATGIVTEIVDGDSVAGTVHLKTRNATVFTAGGESLSSSGTWTGTLTASSEQSFSIWIDANAKSFQTLYDYLAARMTETTLSADGELIWEWCRDQQTQPLYLTGAGFSTERSYGKGIFIVNGGAGTVEKFTDDAGGTYVPPASATLRVTVTNQVGDVKQDVLVRFEESDGTLIAEGSTNASGQFSTSVPVADLPYNNALITTRRIDFEDKDTNINIPTSGFDIPIGLEPDIDVNLP